MTAQWNPASPKSWNTGELVTAALLNQELRDRMEYLKKAHDSVVIIRDEKAQGAFGGTFNSGAWRTRDLNTEVYDPSNLASLASNQITLQPGTYLCFASAPAYTVIRHQARLQNVTDTVTLLLGTSEISGGADAVQTRSFIAGVFSISAQKTLEVQHQCGTSVTTSGFGQNANFTTEVFTTITLIRIGD
jgi:hypothetical protein